MAGHDNINRALNEIGVDFETTGLAGDSAVILGRADIGAAGIDRDSIFSSIRSSLCKIMLSETSFLYLSIGLLAEGDTYFVALRSP